MTQYIYPHQIESALRRFFEMKSYSTPTYVGNEVRDIRFNNHNFNPVFLRISSNQNGKVYEIPSLICEPIVRTEITSESIGESITPLSVIDSQTRRTADSIFKYFFSGNRYNYLNYLGLKKATTSKGEVYYGASGLILNSNFEPIMIGLNEYRKDGVTIHFERCVLKVSPEVFISEGLLEKAIVKKLIPFYSRYDIEGGTARIEIDDISKYVVKPVPPKANVQETMKEIMHTYKDEILKDILP